MKKIHTINWNEYVPAEGHPIHVFKRQGKRGEYTKHSGHC